LNENVRQHTRGNADSKRLKYSVLTVM